MYNYNLCSHRRGSFHLMIFKWWNGSKVQICKRFHILIKRYERHFVRFNNGSSAVSIHHHSPTHGRSVFAVEIKRLHNWITFQLAAACNSIWRIYSRWLSFYFFSCKCSKCDYKSIQIDFFLKFHLQKNSPRKRAEHARRAFTTTAVSGNFNHRYSTHNLHPFINVLNNTFSRGLAMRDRLMAMMLHRFWLALSHIN